MQPTRHRALQGGDREKAFEGFAHPGSERADGQRRGEERRGIRWGAVPNRGQAQER